MRDLGFVDQLQLDFAAASAVWKFSKDLPPMSLFERVAIYSVIAAKAIAVIALLGVVGFGIATAITGAFPLAAPIFAALFILALLQIHAGNWAFLQNEKEILQLCPFPFRDSLFHAYGNIDLNRFSAVPPRLTSCDNL